MSMWHYQHDFLLFNGNPIFDEARTALQHGSKILSDGSMKLRQAGYNILGYKRQTGYTYVSLKIKFLNYIFVKR